MARAKRLLGSLKGGHTGTLDPFATGLLPIAFGEATKFARFLSDAAKSYEATLCLGAETPTGDIESDPVPFGEVKANSKEIDEVLRRFLGGIDQLPPMHSAVRVGGKRLYDYARRGEEIERPARRVHIEVLERIDFSGDRLVVGVTCSKGTYVRTLARDIGRALGCGAYLVALRRTGVGGFRLVDAVALEALEEEGQAAARKRLLPPEALVGALARFDANPDEARRFAHGQAIEHAAPADAEIAVFAPGGRFLGVGRVQAPSALAPLRLMATRVAEVP